MTAGLFIPRGALGTAGCARRAGAWPGPQPRGGWGGIRSKTSGLGQLHSSWPNARVRSDRGPQHVATARRGARGVGHVADGARRVEAR